MSSRLYTTDQHVIPLPPGHKFPITKYQLLRELLERERSFEFEPAPFAEPGEIELVHTSDYVAAFLSGTLSPPAIRRIGFPWSEYLVRRTLASVGGTIAASRDALVSGWGGNLAGGTHHAFANEGSGFCVFNDIAVSIRLLQSEGRIRRAAVVDVDVHQGDGTAHIFRNDPDVLTLSIHCKNNFPLRKQQSKIDIDLDADTGDEAYLDVLRSVLPRVMDFSPDVVFYQSGVDGLRSDVLGRLALTMEGLTRRDEMVISAVAEARLPFVITLGGGYSDPIALTAEAHANTFKTAARVFAVSPVGRD